MQSFNEYMNEHKDVFKKNFTKKEAKKIGDSIGVDWDKIDIDEFIMGLKVEQEHDTKSKNTDVANSIKDIAKIALAHLKEIKDYYTRLNKMEKQAKK